MAAVYHSCHSEEKCPPCTYLTQKWCMGKHEVSLSVSVFLIMCPLKIVLDVLGELLCLCNLRDNQVMFQLLRLLSCIFTASLEWNILLELVFNTIK